MRVLRIAAFCVALLLLSPVNAAEAEPKGIVALTAEFVRENEGKSAVIFLALVFFVSWVVMKIKLPFVYIDPHK